MQITNELFISNEWKTYELIDAGGGNRLERWGKYTVVRPDPQALWPAKNNPLWRGADAIYHRSSSGGGQWEYKNKLPESWTVSYGDYTFKVHPTNFKHMGLFPEQASNWDRINNVVTGTKGANVLNLFGYTGAATIAAAYAGANVCHVDASKGMLSWCSENAALNGIPDERIRLIPDDCLKFVQREGRRGHKYDGIIMDPPSFGRGLKGEVWKLEDHLWDLLTSCKQILADRPLFFLINSYTAGLSPIVTANMLAALDIDFKTTLCGELTLPFDSGKKLLPCGSTVFASN